MDFDEVDEGGDGQAGEVFGEDLFMFAGLNSQEIEELKDKKDSVIFLIDCHSSMYEPNIFN